MTLNSTHWLLIGTGPSVTTWLPQLELSGFCTITCNDGLELVPVPDYYFCVDNSASPKVADMARAAQRQGTHLITLLRGQKQLQDRQTDFYDEFLALAKHTPPTRGQWGQFRYSGPTCVEYACRHGATEVHLVGVDGYRGKGAADYWDGSPAKRKDAMQSQTLQVLQPQLHLLAQLFSEVRFVQYGQPCFGFQASNWEIIT